MYIMTESGDGELSPAPNLNDFMFDTSPLCNDIPVPQHLANPSNGLAR
jgi:hypothetical protein